MARGIFDAFGIISTCKTNTKIAKRDFLKAYCGMLDGTGRGRSCYEILMLDFKVSQHCVMKDKEERKQH